MVHLTFLLCGLFTSCLSFQGSGVSFGVIQSPPRISVNEGSRVHISCCWNISGSGLKVYWFKNHSVQLTQDEKHVIKPYDKNDNCSTLSLTNTDERDAGFFQCEVVLDIPKLLRVRGNGTHVTIQRKNDLKGTKVTPVIPTKEDADQDSDELVIFIFRCVPVVTLLLAVCYLNHDLKKKPRGTPGSENSSNNNRQERDLEEQGEELGDVEGHGEELGDVEEQGEEPGQEGNLEEQGEELGDVEEHGEELGDVEEHGEELGDVEEHGEELGDVEEHGEELGDVEEQGEELGDVEEHGEELEQEET